MNGKVNGTIPNGKAAKAKIDRFCEVDPRNFMAKKVEEEKEDSRNPEDIIRIDPSFAEFIDFGGASRHMIINDSRRRFVFKVKCSNNELFKVSPVHSFLDPGASVEMQILRREGESRREKLVLLIKETIKKTEKDPKIAFQAEATTYRKVLLLISREVKEEYS